MFHIQCFANCHLTALTKLLQYFVHLDWNSIMLFHLILIFCLDSWLFFSSPRLQHFYISVSFPKYVEVVGKLTHFSYVGTVWLWRVLPQPVNLCHMLLMCYCWQRHRCDYDSLNGQLKYKPRSKKYKALCSVQVQVSDFQVNSVYLLQVVFKLVPSQLRPVEYMYKYNKC